VNKTGNNTQGAKSVLPPQDKATLNSHPRLAGGEILKRRLKLAALGIPTGITNEVGSANDKCANFSAMPGGPTKKFPDREEGPGPRGRGAQYRASTDPKTISEWSRQYPNCDTFIGGTLPEDVLCIDIDRGSDFDSIFPGFREELMKNGHPTDKRIGKERYHIWARMPEGTAAKDLPGSCTWGEVKWTGGLVVSSPSQRYESVVPMKSWNEIPRLSKTDVCALKNSGVSNRSPNGTSAFVGAGRHPSLLKLSAKLAHAGRTRESIIESVWAADLASEAPAQLDSERPGDFSSEVERMVTGAINKFGTRAADEFSQSSASRPKFSEGLDSLPKELLEIGGLAGKIAEHINSQSTVKNPELAFWAGIISIAHVTGRHIMTSTGLSPGLGVALLAPSASGKEKPQEILGEIFSRAELGSSIVRKIGSGQGLEDRLGVELKILLLVDEAMHLFKSMADPRLASFSPEALLKEMLSGKAYYTGRVVAKIRGKIQKPVEIFRPHLTFYASAVPDEFFDTINQSMVRGGLFGRLLCPVIPSGPLVSPAPNTTPVPQEIIDEIRHWGTYDFCRVSDNGERQDPKTIPFSNDASLRWESYRTHCHEKATKSANEIGATLWNRAGEKVARLALIKAASRCGIEIEEIVDEDVQWACRVVNFYSLQLIDKTGYAISSNDTEDKRNRFLDIMRKFLKKNPAATEVGHSHILKNIKLDGYIFRQVAADLVDCNLVQIRLAKPRSNNKPTTFYSFPSSDSQVHKEIHDESVNLKTINKSQKGTERSASNG
jgi:hypothetical protein